MTHSSACSLVPRWLLTSASVGTERLHFRTFEGSVATRNAPSLTGRGVVQDLKPLFFRWNGNRRAQLSGALDDELSELGG